MLYIIIILLFPFNYFYKKRYFFFVFHIYSLIVKLCVDSLQNLLNLLKNLGLRRTIFFLDFIEIFLVFNNNHSISAILSNVCHAQICNTKSGIPDLYCLPI